MMNRSEPVITKGMVKMDSLNIVPEKKKDRRELGLYLHIPFCARKCDYCDFLSAPAASEEISHYIEAMRLEIEQYKGWTDGYIVPTVFIGGGTPSYIKAGHIERIMEVLSGVFTLDRQQLEATIEINPGTITKDKLLTYRKAGINRLSFGLQSVNNEELRLLGRIHTYEQFEENYRLARELGFDNINIDLMSALPGQTLPSWENTLYKVTGLKPEHISAYSLILEEGTKFYERYHSGARENAALPDEDTDRQIYHRTKELLESSGYQRYEISNYAKPGYECRHNNSYWIGTEYLGIGLGASSLINGTRFSNLHEYAQYCKLCALYKENGNNQKKCEANDKNPGMRMQDVIGLRTALEVLTVKDQMEEFMFLGLRRCEGISKTDFLHRFGVEIELIYGRQIRQMVTDGLILVCEDNLQLTDYGIDISNYVFTRFLLD